MGACLAWGPGSAVSHPAAAALWRLSGFDPGPVMLTVPRDRRRLGPGTVYRNALSSAELTTLDAIPVTTPARTLFDLASIAPSDVVEEAVDDALRRGLVSMARLRWSLARYSKTRRSGTAVMRAIIDARGQAMPIPQSVFETRLLRFISRSDLPSPRRQHPVRRGGRLIAVLDFAYPEAQLGIEADGYRWHSGRARWEHDLLRRNQLTLEDGGSSTSRGSI